MVAAPVIFKRGRNLKWESVSNWELKELCKAGKEYGKKSPYFKNLLQVVFSAHVLMPYHLQHIMSLLLSPMKLLLWESVWKKQLQILVKNYKSEAGRAHLTVEQLSGDGDFRKPQKQAWYLPRAALEDIKNAAQNALFQTPDGNTPQKSFFNIRQDMDETFIKFIDRLKDAIDKQIDCPRARELLLSKLAVSTANAECKKIIRALPSGPEPTIQQMVEACTQLKSTGRMVALAVSKGVAEALLALNKLNMRCFKCGELGHLKVEYNRDFLQTHPSTSCPSTACLACEEHFKYCLQFQCHQQVQHHLSCQQRQEYFQPSAWPHDTTSNAKLFHASFPTISKSRGTKRSSVMTLTMRRGAGSPRPANMTHTGKRPFHPV